MHKDSTWMAVVALALQDKCGRWMMHKRPEGSDNAGLWEFPGGKVEAGETPAAALVREIAEETGLCLEAERLQSVTFAQSSASRRGEPIVLMLYRADLADLTDAAKPEALEGGELGWFTADEIASLDMAELDIALAERLFRLYPRQS